MLLKKVLKKQNILFAYKRAYKLGIYFNDTNLIGRNLFIFYCCQMSKMPYTRGLKRV